MEEEAKGNQVKQKSSRKIGRRRAFTHKKRHRTSNRPPSSDATATTTTSSSTTNFSDDSVDPAPHDSANEQREHEGTPVFRVPNAPLWDLSTDVESSEDRPTSSCTSMEDSSSDIDSNRSHGTSSAAEESDHCYSKPLLDENTSPVMPPCLSPEVTVELLLLAREKLQLCLPPFWTVFVDRNNVHVMMLSRQSQKAVQRTINCSVSGDMQLSVHCQPVSIDPFLKGVSASVILSPETLGEYCDRIVKVVSNVRLMEVCAGVDNIAYRSVWDSVQLGEVDSNPYQECRYLITYRSPACSRLIECSKWKCKECSKLMPFLKRRYNQSLKENFHPNTRNDNLTDTQKLKKLKQQREKIEAQRKKIDQMQLRMQNLLKKEGVTINKNMSEDFHELLRNGNLSPAQSMFLQQQIKASQQKNMAGMRWHPSLIRIALAIHTNSRSTYEMLRQSGVIRLPSSRTLFDYSHAENVKEGIDEVTLKDLAEKVSKFDENYKKYHNIMADEMFTSKNLVFHKQSGELRGFMKLNDLDKEMKMLENYLDDPDRKYCFEMSNKILSFLVKGVCTSVKEVIATYAVNTVSVKQMYFWSWEVIGACERSGIKIAAFICDGSATNRAFIKLHAPAEDKFLHESVPGNAIYVTLNKAAPSRNLYFIADVPHLLKTIRNCFKNSRIEKGKGTRCLKLNGERIVWDTIIDLYNFNKARMLRKSYKLNAQNVYPDSYSCMRVSLAGQVLSNTVATDIEQSKFPNTKETVRFIRFVNNWFDCLNGAHTYHGRRKKNPRLDPYTKPDDIRFGYIISFVEYLDEWRKQAEKRTDDSICSNAQAQHNNSATEDDPLQPIEDVDEVDDTPAGKAQLSHQTALGIEISTKSFISCVRFLLSEGCPFVNARAFTQDPLEQYFGKLRSGFGGSTNPNSGQCLIKQRAIHLQGQLGVKRRGNTQGGEGTFQVTDEPLPKRKSTYSLDLKVP